MTLHRPFPVVATHRNDAEERVKWQSAIPSLLNHLGTRQG